MAKKREVIYMKKKQPQASTLGVSKIMKREGSTFAFEAKALK